VSSGGSLIDRPSSRRAEDKNGVKHPLISSPQGGRIARLGRCLFKNSILLDPEAAQPVRGGLLIEQGRIVRTIPAGEAEPRDAEVIDLDEAYLAPGFLDLHYHGSLPLCDASGFAASLTASSASLASSGTTAFLATTVTTPYPELTEDLTQLASLIGESASWPGAVPIGVHLEGPWISEGASGAQPRRAIRPYRTAEAGEVLAAIRDLVRLVTFAPEIEGAAELQRVLARSNIPMALGHSLATAGQVEVAVDRGASHVTHLFNAMGLLHHREPGLAGAALSDDRLSCDLICDGVHVDPAMVKLAARAKGDRLVLITDRIEIPDAAQQYASSFASTSASSNPRASASNSASLSSTLPRLGGEAIHDDGTALRLADGRLAGSRLSLDRAIGNARQFANWSLLEAVAACTLRPARVIGIEAERGTLRAGARADLVVLDASGAVRETWVGGVNRLR